MATKHAEVTWKGALEDGAGTIERVGSDAFSPLNVSWPARTGDEAGMTSPEELIAAAHASCFSMALSNVLNKAGFPAGGAEGLGRRDLRSRDGDHVVGAGRDGQRARDLRG